VDDHLTDKLVNRPAHYTGGDVECIQAIKAATKGLPAFEAICVGHVIRYLWRYRVKHPQNPLVDVKKSVFYLNRLDRRDRKSRKEITMTTKLQHKAL
jgi:hypothetical protein